MKLILRISLIAVFTLSAFPQDIHIINLSHLSKLNDIEKELDKEIDNLLWTIDNTSVNNADNEVLNSIVSIMNDAQTLQLISGSVESMVLSLSSINTLLISLNRSHISQTHIHRQYQDQLDEMLALISDRKNIWNVTMRYFNNKKNYHDIDKNIQRLNSSATQLEAILTEFQKEIDSLIE